MATELLPSTFTCTACGWSISLIGKMSCIVSMREHLATEHPDLTRSTTEGFATNPAPAVTPGGWHAIACPERGCFWHFGGPLEETAPQLAKHQASEHPEPDPFMAVTCYACPWSAYVPKSRTLATITAHRDGMHDGEHGPWSVVA